MQATWERDRLLTMTDGQGRPFEPDATYRFVATDYITGRPGDAEFVFGQIPEDRTSAPTGPAREAIVELLRATEIVLGQDGAWPLPDPEAPRIRTDKTP